MGMNAATNHKGNPLTLAEYRQLELAGKLTRPITDWALGAATEGKRANDAVYSSLHTEHDSPVPTGPPSTWGARPRAAGGENTPAAKRARAARRNAARAREAAAGTSTTPEHTQEHTA
jgi:hypothetical protein